MYVLLTEQHDRRVTARVQACAAIRAGGFDVEVPNPVFEREQFDAALNAAPETATAVLSLIRELGVA